MIGLLAITSIIFLLPTVIYVTSDEKTLGRLAYFFRSALLGFICSTLVFINIEKTSDHDDYFNIFEAPINDAFLGGSWIIFIVIVFTVCFQSCWMVHRLNHIGWSRWTVLFMLIPLVGGIFGFLLMTVPGRKVTQNYSELFT
ncbi:DUF805 domain-containing protein [Kiloniella antarctica]|uniref:DUF805 domain-containing protein n=1 Tax=Kiloniella antarctica TaxID=1550907 RepID=A0ABW5BQ12_9PROT